MAAIAAEAEQQGFQVRQTRSGMWHIRKGNDNWCVQPTNVKALLNILSALIAAGLDWSHYWD
jgi:hypothetical protein